MSHSAPLLPPQSPGSSVVVMDIETVCSLLHDLDTTSYHSASDQKQTLDDVWPPQLEDAFIQAVRVFATVGQKKYQIEEARADGYSTELIGRNDIISRYIFMKTVQFRTRKQVSSHIQVWAHCRRPPSSRDMPASEFERLQAIFRQYYSRQSSDQRHCKKRGRRVASASSASAAHRALSRSSLGIYTGARSPASVTGSMSAEGKRNSPWFDDSPAKRCRRVVSELPRLDFGLHREHGDSLAELMLMGSHSFQPHWKPDSAGAMFAARAVSGGALGGHSQSLGHGSPLLAHPTMLLPPLGISADAGHGVYDLGIASPADPSVAAFAATLAAMSRFESDGSSPALGAGDCVAALPPAAPCPQAYKGVAATGCDGALTFAAGAISAFASATTAADSPGSSSPHLRHLLPAGAACSTPVSSIDSGAHCSDIYAPLPPSSWGCPSMDGSVAYRLQPTGPALPPYTSALGCTAIGLDGPAAAVGTACSSSDRPSSSAAPSTRSESCALLAGADRLAGCLADRLADRYAGDRAPALSQGTPAEDPPSSPALAALAVDFVSEWMERIHRAGGESCDPELLTASTSSANGGSGDCNYDWDVNFLPFISYPL
ncbi:hypothetical protein H4R19_000053 [Coemansia spiralis]|nr:hypothetical protein H4R19_000053 [Coemansia spiralis]